MYHAKSRGILLISGVCRGHFATIVAKIVAKIAKFLQHLQQRVTARSSDQSQPPHDDVPPPPHQ